MAAVINPLSATDGHGNHAMPIKPENRKRYPKDWQAIRAAMLERAGNACEFCGAMNNQPHPITNSRVVLTIAHLDHTPEHCDPANLRALCCKCHLAYDANHHAQTAYQTRRAGKAAGDLFAYA